jgi:hypothetical protein
MDHVAQAWLFVRGEESIRITTAPQGTLRIFGPRDASQSCDFTDATSLEQFVESYRQRLLNDGWVLAVVAERRQADTQVSPAHERRAQERRTRKPD